jgi:hypothetical protein
MASLITVKLKYDDNSKSLVEEYPCADAHPSAEVIKDCEQQSMDKWAAMGGSWRSLQTHTTVKIV